MRVLIIFVLGLGLIFAPTTELHAATKKKSSPYEGSLSTRYKYRSGAGETDQDIQSMLTLNYNNSRFDKFSGAFQVGGVMDLDGSEDGATFNDIYQTFSETVVPRIYYAYATVRNVGLIDQIRIGRQHFIQMEPYYLDGASIQTVALNGFVISAFGGMPVHLYENVIGSDPGDWMAGGAIEWTPITRLRFRFEYAHEQDDASGFNAGRGNLADDLLGASAWLTLSKHVDLYGRFTTFTDQPRDVQFSSTFSFPDQKVSVRVNARRLLAVEKARVSDWDDFRIAGSYRPYTQAGVTVTKDIGKKFSVDGGADLRFLDADQAGTAFNHGYRRFFLTASTHDWIAKDLQLSLSGNYYNGTDNTLRNDNAAVSFAASRRFYYGQGKKNQKKEVKEEKRRKQRKASEFGFGDRRVAHPVVATRVEPVTETAPVEIQEAQPPATKTAPKKSSFKPYVNVDAGSAYYLYRYNLLMGNESDDVRTYYAGIQWAMLQDLSLKVNYEFEDNSVSQFHTVTSSFLWNF